MTVLEALQSMVEYTNANLLAKALLDNGVTNTGATYTAANEKTVDLAAADVYMALSTHPKWKEGSRYIDYSSGMLRSLARELQSKHGVLQATVSTPQDSRYNKVW